ncbi:MAG TPA: hypothetical protein VFP14_09695, partial [Novosphingobium sp.]|nr:hypothetical protein [Novosphingobium sp.]
RMAAKYRAYAAEYGTSAPKVSGDEAVQEAISKADNSAAPVNDAGTTPDTVHEEPPTPASGKAADITSQPASPTPAALPALPPGAPQP